MEDPTKYPWYELVEGDNLAQGDILLNCPAIRPTPDAKLEDFYEKGNLAIEIEQVDAIILTQSCDLANDKIDDVLLCAHYDLKQIIQENPSLKNKLTQVRNGQVYRYTLLPDFASHERLMGVRMVDFSYVFTFPKYLVKQIALSQGKRLRLCPPYREHLSQAFARFFMRVGLPQEIKLPE